MQPMTRMSRKELVELIETTEAAGNDATELRNFLAQLPEEGRPRQPARGGGRRLSEEEETTEEHLNNKVGHLFPGGISGELLARILDMDWSYNLNELKQMCRENGLSASSEKKVMAAILIAHNADPKAKSQQGVYKVCQRLELCHTVRASTKKEAEDIAMDKGETDAEVTQLQDWTARRI